MADSITQGNTLHTDLLVKDDFDVLVDPMTLTLTVKTPANVQTIYTYPTAVITKSSTGTFYGEFVLSEIGVWKYQWDTTSPSRDKGGEVYVEASSISSPPSVGNVADYTRFYLGGENWFLLTTLANFGISHVILGIEAVKRRILPSPPAPKDESALNGNLLAYLGILSALELLPAARDAWANKIISRSIGNDPAELTAYTDRSKRIDDLQNDLLRRVPDLRRAALPYLDPTLNLPSSVIAIDEVDDYKVTEEPRDFPPICDFPYPRGTVIYR